jgi:hypothetical protein
MEHQTGGFMKGFIVWLWEEWPLAVLVFGAILILGVGVVLCELDLPSFIANK